MFHLLAKLIVAHYVADYPLQGDFLAAGKNHVKPIPGVPWYQALIAHAAIHAGFVWLLTGSPTLAGIELIAHAAIDWLKCDGRISYNVDQGLHLACKALYAAVWLLLKSQT